MKSIKAFIALFSQLLVCNKTVIRKYWSGKTIASSRRVAGDSSGPASRTGAPKSRSHRGRPLASGRRLRMLRGPSRPAPRPTCARRAQARGSRQPARNLQRDAAAVRGEECGRMEPLKVEKFSTTDRGNGLRALAPLRPGELLFRSDPLAYTVCKGSRGVVCDRCLLGYVRSALAHLNPIRGVRGTAGRGTPPGRGCTGARRCCGGVQPRTLLVQVLGTRRGWGTPPGHPLGCRAGARVLGPTQARSLQGGAGAANTHSPWAAVGIGGSRWDRLKGKRWAGDKRAGEQKSVSCAACLISVAVEIIIGGGWCKSGSQLMLVWERTWLAGGERILVFRGHFLWFAWRWTGHS